jgi:hypothetical protein
MFSNLLFTAPTGYSHYFTGTGCKSKCYCSNLWARETERGHLAERPKSAKSAPRERPSGFDLSTVRRTGTSYYYVSCRFNAESFTRLGGYEDLRSFCFLPMHAHARLTKPQPQAATTVFIHVPVHADHVVVLL